MRTKVTLVLVFLNVALFFFIFKFEPKWDLHGRVADTQRRVLGPEAADIRALEVTNPATPAASFSLSRRRDTWWLSKPIEWPANPLAVSSITNGLQLLEHESSFSAKDLAKSDLSLATYGFDKPKLHVEFHAGESPDTPPTVLEFGDLTKTGNLIYLRTLSDDRIHVVSRDLFDSLSLPLGQLRSDTLLNVPLVEARGLTIRVAGGAAPVALTRDRADNTRWSFESPIISLASKLEVGRVINELNALHAVNFSPPPPPGALPAASPALKVTLDATNRRETLYLGDTLGSTAIPTAAATAPDVELYAQLEGRAALFTVAVPAALLERLRNAPERLREKHVLDFNALAVTAITLAAPNQTPITLQRDPAAPPDSPWQIVRRVEGNATATTPNPGASNSPLPADLSAIKRLLQQLAGLEATKFQSDAPNAAEQENWGFNRPERVVTLTLAGGAPPQMLQIGTDAKRDTYARLGPNGSSIYAVPSEILRELDVSPRAWRDRLVRELPTAARITALKLTDLENSSTLLDLALDADGKAKADTADAKAITIVVAQLRSLRAQKFVQDGFTDRFMFFGEERTWKYQLDATVSLPGGAGGAQTSVKTLLLSVRGGGGQQLAGDKENDALFEIDQLFLDALWKLTPAGRRDPGPPAAIVPAKAP